MKTLVTSALMLAVGWTTAALAADSKRTAEYTLANANDLEGKEVTLDVAFVKPVQWKSPIPEYAFFHAITIDRNDRKRGGHILVAIPAEDSGKFAKKYGMDFDGRTESDTLRGTLIAAPGHKLRARVWIVDTTGKLLEVIKDRKVEIEETGPVDEGGPGPGEGGGGFGGGPGPAGNRPPRPGN